MKTSLRRANHSSIYTCTCFGHVWKHLHWGAELLRLMWLENILPKTRGFVIGVFFSHFLQENNFWTSFGFLVVFFFFSPFDLKKHLYFKFSFFKRKIPWEKRILFVHLQYQEPKNSKLLKRVFSVWFFSPCLYLFLTLKSLCSCLGASCLSPLPCWISSPEWHQDLTTNVPLAQPAFWKEEHLPMPDMQGRSCILSHHEHQWDTLDQMPSWVHDRGLLPLSFSSLFHRQSLAKVWVSSSWQLGTLSAFCCWHWRSGLGAMCFLQWNLDGNSEDLRASSAGKSDSAYLSYQVIQAGVNKQLGLNGDEQWWSCL